MKKLKGNPKSSYYDGDGKVTMLDIWTSQLTKDEFIGLCKGNIIKYLTRKKGNKKTKILDYEKAYNYATYLMEITNENDNK